MRGMIAQFGDSQTMIVLSNDEVLFPKGTEPQDGLYLILDDGDLPVGSFQVMDGTASAPEILPQENGAIDPEEFRSLADSLQEHVESIFV